MILAPETKNIELICDYLREGDIVGMPTETVYGLAGWVQSAEAIKKIFEVKKRPHFDPLITHIPASWANFEKLSEQRIIDAPKLDKQGTKKICEDLMKRFWPGPLTIIFPKHPDFSEMITAGLQSVAVRCPSHAVFQSVLEKFNGALAAPSANSFGRISPTTAQDVEKELPQLKAVLDGGAAQIGIESTVLRIPSANEIQILRAGRVTREDIAQMEPQLQITTPSAEDSKVSPGQTQSHYAPKTPLWTFRRLNQVDDLSAYQKVSVLFWSNELSQPLPKHTSINKVILSPKGDPAEMAFHLFKTLRNLDESGSELILAQTIDNPTGIEIAICDRLQRAGSRSF